MTQLSLVWDRTENTKKRSEKLTGDKRAILKLLENGNCWLVSDLAAAIGNLNHPSVSANIRNLRRDKFEIKLIKFGNGINGYQLNKEEK